MRSQSFTAETDGFHGTWYPCEKDTDTGMIIMLGDSSDDTLAKCGAKWMHLRGCHAMAMSPGRKDYGHHSYPLERFVKAISFMKENGCKKIGIVGASTTGMLALVAASYFDEISLTIAVSPSDFIMEGFYRDGKDGMSERPGDDESSISYQGKDLPYLPYAYRHPEYWKMIQKESKESHNMVASRQMFDESEKRHPLKEEEKIKVERIKGKIICIGAQDDVLWDTCKYIRRMEERLNDREHDSDFEAWIYEHGTHFAFPESLLKMMLPIGSSLLVSLMFIDGRKHKKECRQTRIDIDDRLKKAIDEWREK